MERVPVKPSFVLLLASLVLAGCSAGSDPSATKAEEENFRNPSKTPPAGASNIGGPPPGARK